VYLTISCATIPPQNEALGEIEALANLAIFLIISASTLSTLTVPFSFYSAKFLFNS
jgi:hypothetical protein